MENRLHDICDLLINNISFNRHFTSIQKTHKHYTNLHAETAKLLFHSDAAWLELNNRTKTLEEATEVAHLVLKRFDWKNPTKTNTTTINRDTLIKKALKKALNKRSANSMSLFNPRRLRDILYDYDIKASPEEVTFLSMEALHPNNRDISSNPAILKLCKELNRNPIFEHRFIKQSVTPVNEYQLKAFCKEFDIEYDNSIYWKDIIYKCLKLNMGIMHKDYLKIKAETYRKENSEQQFKQKEKSMPIDTLTTSSNISNQLKQDEQNMSFLQVVTTDIVHTVNDKPVNNMSKQDLFESALQLEKSIERLHTLKRKSKAVKKEVKQQKKVLKQVIKYLDAK